MQPEQPLQIDNSMSAGGGSTSSTGPTAVSTQWGQPYRLRHL